MARTLTGEVLNAAKSLTETQAHYIYALGVYTQASEAATALWEAVPADAGDEEFTRAFDLIEKMAPTTVLYDALRTAEDRMVAACRRFVMLDPVTARRFARNRAMLANMFTGYRRYPSIAAKLIQACRELDPYR